MRSTRRSTAASRWILTLACLVLLGALPGSVGCSGGQAGARKVDVLLVTVDSLRADRPGFTGGRVETPAMDAIASGGTLFTQAITTSPQTLPSLASLHTSMYPPALKVRDDGKDRLPDDTATLAALMKKAGYRTGAYAAALALHPKHGLDRGFDTYADAFADIPRPRTSLAIGLPAVKIVDGAIEWLGALKPEERFFLWVNFFDPHYFYEPPQEIRDKYADRPYDGEIAFVDRELGRLMRWIADHGRDKDLLIVLAGNHGEGLGDGGEQFHGILLRESTLRVPLVVRPAGAGGSAAGGAGATAGSGSSASGSSAPAAAARVDQPVSLIDIAPTILEMSGSGPAPAAMQGVSLAGYLGHGEKPAADRTLYFETMLPRTLLGWAPMRGVRAGSMKYVEAVGAGAPSLFDLAADPNESNDLAASKPDDVKRLADSAARLGGTMNPKPDPLPPAAVDVVRNLGFPTEAPAGAPIAPATLVAAGNEALQGHRSFQRRMAQATEFLLKGVLDKDPGDYLALTDLAVMRMGQRNSAEADALLRRAQQRYPSDGEVYHQLGHLLLMQAMEKMQQGGKVTDEFDRARNLFELAVRLDPLNEEALYDSSCALAQTNPDVSLTYLEQAIRNGFRDYAHMSRDSDLDPLRSNPRFAQVTDGKVSTTLVAKPPQPAPPASKP